MEVEAKAWAYDSVAAIDEIGFFLKDTPDFAAYKQDMKTKRAVERNLEIIGEAMNRILKKNPAAGFTDARKIVETRNRIVHGYDSVSDEIVWGIVTGSLQQLKAEAERFLGE